MPGLAAELERHPGMWRGSEITRAGCSESLERAQQLLGTDSGCIGAKWSGFGPSNSRFY
jgi:hypothetical protein